MANTLFKQFEEKMKEQGVNILDKTSLKARVEEIDRLERIRLAELNKAAETNLPDRFDSTELEKITPDEKQKSLYEFCQKLVQAVSQKQEKNGIILGSVGSGKTMFLSSAVSELGKQGFTGCLITLADMLLGIKAAHSLSIAAVYEKIKYFSEVSLLVLDEIDAIKFTEKDFELLNTVINNRYNSRLSTVVLSNKNIDQVKEILGDRIIDRLRTNGGCQLSLNMKSKRS